MCDGWWGKGSGGPTADPYISNGAGTAAELPTTEALFWQAKLKRGKQLSEERRQARGQIDALVPNLAFLDPKTSPKALYAHR